MTEPDIDVKKSLPRLDRYFELVLMALDKYSYPMTPDFKDCLRETRNAHIDELGLGLFYQKYYERSIDILDIYSYLAVILHEEYSAKELENALMICRNNFLEWLFLLFFLFVGKLMHLPIYINFGNKNKMYTYVKPALNNDYYIMIEPSYILKRFHNKKYFPVSLTVNFSIELFQANKKSNTPDKQFLLFLKSRIGSETKELIEKTQEMKSIIENQYDCNKIIEIKSKPFIDNPISVIETFISNSILN